MKARPRPKISEADRDTIEAAVRDKVNEEIERIQAHAVRQAFALVLYTLHTSYGFGEQRLQKFFRLMSAACDDMRGVGFSGEFSAGDLIETAKNEWGIDLEKEVNFEWTAKKN